LSIFWEERDIKISFQTESRIKSIFIIFLVEQSSGARDILMLCSNLVAVRHNLFLTESCSNNDFLVRNALQIVILSIFGKSGDRDNLVGHKNYNGFFQTVKPAIGQFNFKVLYISKHRSKFCPKKT
jgi:hypothetical protein